MNNRQKEEMAKFCLDVSKIAIASWIFGLLTSKIELPQILLFLLGLTISALFLKIGMNLFKEVK
jgi:hypothetical protein